MRRAAPLARAALQVTMYTMFFLYLGILVVSCAELMSFATERSLGFAQAVERLMFLPLTAAIVALLLGLALGMLLGLAVATALLVVQGHVAKPTPPALHRRADNAARSGHSARRIRSFGMDAYPYWRPCSAVLAAHGFCSALDRAPLGADSRGQIR